MDETHRDPGITRRDLVKKAGKTAVALGVGGAAFGGRTRISRAAGRRTDGGTTLTIGAYNDDSLTPISTTFAKQFTKETGIKIKWIETDYTSWFPKITQDAQSGAGAYDLYGIDPAWLGQLVAMKAVVNLDQAGFHLNPKLLRKGYRYWPPKTGPRQKAFKNETAALYAIPLNDDCQLLYYNKKYFSKTPETWDELTTIIKHTANPKKKLYGWAMRGIKGNPIFESYRPLLYANSGDWFDGQWAPTFAGPAGVHALQWLLEMKPYMPPGVAAFDTDQEIQSMLQGHTMAAIDYTGSLRSLDDPSKSKMIGQINVGLIPKVVRHAAGNGPNCICISSHSHNKSAALHYLSWWESDRIQLQFARTGGAADTAQALNDPVAGKKYRWMKAIEQNFAASVPVPATTDLYKVEDIIGLQLNLALVDGNPKNAQKYLRTAANQVHDYLKQQGTYY